VPAIYFVKAQQVRRRARDFFREIFERVDLLASPTLPMPAPTIAEVEANEAAATSRLTAFMPPFNLLGLPALSVPCGLSADGRPIGLMLAGPAWSEATLFRAAHAYEQASGWWKRHPDL
jgi:aspartyl-tRNA(Asn)/glutamyl-tRNA(Gln) amidotransferase subunit A